MTTLAREARNESTGERWRRWTEEWTRMARVALTPSAGLKTGQIYDIIGPQNLFGEESLFINFGYWAGRPTTLDEASRELARLVARTAEFGPGDEVVDCGPGYGDQDILWVKEFKPTHITGVNPASEQIAISERRVRQARLSKRISYVEASATALPFEDESCTKVVALESAFHFPSRVDFFTEALRVLKPGGRLVTADIVPKRTPLTALARAEVGRRGWRSASRAAVAQAADVEGYRSLLGATGFIEADVQPITDDVYPPLGRFLHRRLRDPAMRHVNPLLRYTFTPLGFRFSAWHSDYIVATAVKATP